MRSHETSWGIRFNFLNYLDIRLKSENPKNLYDVWLRGKRARVPVLDIDYNDMSQVGRKLIQLQ